MMITMLAQDRDKNNLFPHLPQDLFWHHPNDIPDWPRSTNRVYLSLSNLAAQSVNKYQKEKNEVINLSKTPKPDHLFSQVMGAEWGGFCLNLNDI